MLNWIRSTFPGVWSARYFFLGAAAFGAVWGLSAWADLTHSTGPENYHSMAWAYITLAIGITSILYPLALTIRDSLTSRLFIAYGKLRATKDAGIKWTDCDPDIQSFMDNSFKPLQRFRRVLFDIQLPILAVFSLLSVLRTLFCLVQLGPLPVAKQMIEPQFYMFAYVVWLIWVAVVILRYRPFYAIEKAETDSIGLPTVEQSFAQELADKSNLTPPNQDEGLPQSENEEEQSPT